MSPLEVFTQIPAEHVIVGPNEYWDAPGHNCIIYDRAGNEWIIYHQWTSKIVLFTELTDLRKMCMDRIFYTADGLPYVKNASPSFTRQEGPVVMSKATLKAD